MTIVDPEGMYAPLERILVRFVNGYEDGVRFNAGDIPYYGWQLVAYGKFPESIGDFNPCEISECNCGKHKAFDEAVDELAAEFLSCSFYDVEIPFTTPKLPKAGD